MSVITKALLVDFGTIILTFVLLCLRANPACTDPQIFSVTSKESDAIRQKKMEYTCTYKIYGSIQTGIGSHQRSAPGVSARPG